MDLFDSFATKASPHTRPLTVGFSHQTYQTDQGHAAPDDLLRGLNPAQAEAVAHHGGPLLIVAGAGSGKTRVLTHRIAYLLATGRAQPGEIMAITFTNKAAAEMRERVGSLVGPGARRMLVATFHSACVRMLREHHDAAGLKSTFSIYDTQDSQRLLTMILKAQDVDVKRYTPRVIANRISDLKNELITPEQYLGDAPADPVSQIVAVAYPEFNKRLRQANAVDFDDIIMLTVQMLANNPAIAEFYRRRYRHILVDEYQDTNHAQYVLIRHLVSGGTADLEPGELTVVGDSDQSIYAFRGATIRNIEEFEKDYPNAATILLEQNYRSTGNILSAANAVISRNEGRRPKNLWTAEGDGDKIVVDVLDSEYEEARNIIKEIDKLGSSGEANWGDIAIFYRTNAQSRSIEEMLLRSGIPYRIVGGTRFYERLEIKDAMAYLQVVVNPEDTVALRRVINTPRRGIGDKAEAAIMAYADRLGISYGQALAQIAQGEMPEGLSPRSAASAGEFWRMLDDMRAQAEEGASTAAILDQLMDRSGYLAKLRASEDPQDATRVDNLAELLSVAEEFDTERRNAGEEGSPLPAFLERVALVADADQIPGEDDRDGAVTLMTVHTAKGLEFPYVFVTGLEDGTFPHRRSLEDPSELAEERRLAYVAITRARKKLYLTRAVTRSAWGQSEVMPASRFLDDLPEQTLERRHESRHEAFVSSSSSSGTAFGSGPAGSLQESFVRSQPTKRLGGPTKLGQSKARPVLSLSVGDRVKHGKYGEGTVVSVDGSGQQSTARIDFGGIHKRLLLRMAPLKKL